MSERALRAEPAVTVECLSCRHVGVLTGGALLRLAITPGTPIAAFAPDGTLVALVTEEGGRLRSLAVFVDAADKARDT